MIVPTLPSNESARLETLEQYEIVDTEGELIFDDFTQLAAHICGVPISLISLIDETRQWFKSKVGFSAQSTSRAISFCGHAILQNDLFEVEDAANDVRFSDNPIVIGKPNIRFYAGMPLTTEAGHNLGTLCVMDTISRTLSASQRDALKRLARQVMSQIEHRNSLKKINQLNYFLNEKIRFIQNITDAIPVFISYYDKHLICQFANAIFKKLYDVEPKLLIGQSLIKMAPPELFPEVQAHAFKALTGDVQRFETCLTLADGSVGYGDVRYIPNINLDGSVEGFFSVGVGITDIKKAQQAQKLATAVFENISEGIMITDANHNIVTVNPSFCKMTGYTLDEVIGKIPHFLNPHHDNTVFKEIFYKLNRDKFWFGRMDTRKKSGEIFFTILRIVAVIGDDGNVTHFITSIVDYTKEHEYELERLSLTNMLTRTGEMAKVGGWELDIATRKIKRSSEALRILGLTSSLLMPMELAFDFYGEEALNAIEAAINRCIKDGTTWDLVLPITTADGRKIWIQSRGERICENGVPVKLTGAIQDVTERKNSEIYRLAQENEHKNSLVREVHHRIKNNLQGITNLLFNFGVKYPTLNEVLRTAGTQIQSVAIIHGLQGSSIKSKVELTHLLISIVKHFESVWQTQITLSLSENVLPIYLTETESVPISLILNELISNAIKHSSNNANINIGFSFDHIQKEAHILIANEGQLVIQKTDSQLIEGAGLSLLHALMPKGGAKFNLNQSESQVIACLKLATPVIEF